LGLFLVLSFRQLVCIAWKMPSAVLPTPIDVAMAIQKHWVTLLVEGWITLKATLYGFALALILGIPLAVGVALFPRINLMFYPILIALQSVPKVALAPILLVWLGIGIESKLAIAWLVAFFPIIVDTSAGLPLGGRLSPWFNFLRHFPLSSQERKLQSLWP
jgi:NitT/TauT family transport system permease protein